MKKKERLLRLILTAATILMLALLAWQCLDIYLVGNSPANLDEKGLYIQPVYRAEDVMARLSGLRIWAIGYLVLLLAVCVMVPGDARKGNTASMKQKCTDLPEAAAKSSRVGYVRIGLYAVAVILIVLGIHNGGMRDVLVKAINICTECIGLG